MALRRPYISEIASYVPAPVGGWNPDANPWELADNQAPVLDNFLIRPGKISVRGATAIFADWTASAPVRPRGWVTGVYTGAGDSRPWLLVGRASAGGAVDQADAAWSHNASATLTTAAASGIWSSGPGGTNLSALTMTADQTPGPRWTNYDGLLYGISMDATAAVIADANSNYHIKPTNMLTLAANQTAATVPTVQSAAPHGAIDIVVYQNRVWLLAGCDTPGGSTVHQPNGIYFTIPGASGVGTTSADWRDPVLGTTNQIQIDRDTSDVAVGFGRLRNALVIFRHNSIYALRGTTTSTYTMQLVSREVGCVDQRSIVETDRGIYFLSHRGLMLTDGISISNVSGTILRTLQQAIGITRANAFQHGYATAGLLADGAIIISIGTDSSSGMTPRLAAMYDPNTNTWTRLTSAIWGTSGELLTPNANNLYPGFVFSNRNPRLTVALGNTFVTALENEWQNTSILLARGLVTVGLYDQLTSSPTYQAIPAQWLTHLIGLTANTTGGARRVEGLKRIYMDYQFQAGSSFTPTTGFAATPVDSSQNALAGTTATGVTISTSTNANDVVNDAAPAPLPLIQRAAINTLAEANDISFLVKWADATPRSVQPTTPLADVYGIGVTYLPGMEMPLP